MEVLACPVGVAVDGEGNLLVADNAGAPRIVKISPWGAWLDVWHVPMEVAGGYLQGVAAARTGEAYVTAYSRTNRPAVVKYSAGGEVVGIWR
jgi:hypothetical protein